MNIVASAAPVLVVSKYNGCWTLSELGSELGRGSAGLMTWTYVPRGQTCWQ
jgi:hypothetical protein